MLQPRQIAQLKITKKKGNFLSPLYLLEGERGQFSCVRERGRRWRGRSGEAVKVRLTTEFFSVAIEGKARERTRRTNKKRIKERRR